jgi:hypothetical protein
MTKTIPERTVYSGGVAFKILPDVNGGKLPPGTTPKVENGTHFVGSSVAPVSVTNFLRGADFQTIQILGDGFTTVVNNATIKTNTAANKLLAVNKVYRFTNFNGVWIEDA